MWLLLRGSDIILAITKISHRLLLLEMCAVEISRFALLIIFVVGF
jgi:hypothetical protein